MYSVNYKRLTCILACALLILNRVRVHKYCLYQPVLNKFCPKGIWTLLLNEGDIHTFFPKRVTF